MVTKPSTMKVFHASCHEIRAININISGKQIRMFVNCFYKCVLPVYEKDFSRHVTNSRQIPRNINLKGLKLKTVTGETFTCSMWSLRISCAVSFRGTLASFSKRAFVFLTLESRIFRGVAWKPHTRVRRKPQDLGGSTFLLITLKNNSLLRVLFFEL